MIGDIDILYEDKDVIVVYKSPLLAVSTAKISERDLYSVIKKYLSDREGKETDVNIVHRLDQPVKGVIVFSKNAFSSKELGRQFQSHETEKKYYALVQGFCNAGETKRLINNIYKDSKLNKSVIFNGNRSDKLKLQKAELEYSVISSDKTNNYSLLEISLLTGRFHQIRVQLAEIGHPIIMDEKYGYDRDKDPLYNIEEDKGQICLASYSLSFKQPHTKKTINVSLPVDKAKLVDFLRKYE